MNPFDMVKNLKNLQSQMGELQEEMAALTETGSAGGNIVQVTLNGKFELVGLKIDPVAVDPRDVQMLQDLIVAAHHAAMEKITETLKSKSSSLLGGLGGMNIPGMGN